MRKIAVLLVIVLTVTFSFQASEVEVHATGIELVIGELLYDLLLSIVVTTAGQAFVDEMVEAGYVAGEIELSDIGEFIRAHKKLLLVAGGVAIVDLISGETDTTVDLTPDDLDMTEGNMAQDLVTGQNTVDERKQDFMDWYFDSVEYVGTYPDGDYKVKEPVWSNTANKYYYVYRFYDTLEEAFSHFPYEYQQMMHEFGEDWVEWYSKVWADYQIENDLVSAAPSELPAGFSSVDSYIESQTWDWITHLNSFRDTHPYIYYIRYNDGQYDFVIRTDKEIFPLWQDLGSTQTALKLRTADYTEYNYRSISISSSVSSGTKDETDYIGGAGLIDQYAIYDLGATDDNKASRYVPLDIPILSDSKIITNEGTAIDVPFEEDEEDKLRPAPDVIPGVDLPGIGEADVPSQDELIRENTGLLTEIKEWIRGLTESRAVTEPDDQTLKPTNNFQAPSIPNLIALLILILIQILLLFIKGFVLVGLIFKIPVSTTLFNAEVLEAIEKTKELTLGQFNLSIHELLTWIVTFVFTFLLLKTLKRHLDTFRVT